LVGIADTGSIIVANSDGLSGQIIIDALNTTGAHRTATHYAGQVLVREPNAEEVVASASAQPEQAPLYERSLVDLGGGSIGLVPFAVHGIDCKPVFLNNQPGTMLTSSFFSESRCEGGPLNPAQNVEIEFYGPLTDAARGGPPPVEITMKLGNACMFDPQVVAMITAKFSVSIVGRRLVIVPAPGVSINDIEPGEYCVRARGSELLCADLPVGVVAPIAFDFHFILAPDCNGNGCLDPEELAADTEHVLDCDCDGLIDSCEIAMDPSLDVDPMDGFLDNCGCADCPADFNQDGNLDPDDLADYISAFFSVPPLPAADFNDDGNVDPDDLADFISAFFAGC